MKFKLMTMHSHAARLGAGALLALAALTSHVQAADRNKDSAKPGGILLSAMDPAVDACDNLYLRACGGFLATTQADAAHPSIDMTTQAFEANLESSFAALFAQDVSKDPELARLKTFQSSCLSGTAGDGALVAQWLGRIDAARSPAQIRALLLELSKIGVDPFFTYMGQPDRTQRGRYRGEIHNSYLWANQETVLTSFLAAGVPQADAQRDAAAVSAITQALGKEKGNRYDARTAENPRTLAELTQLAPSFDWQGYFAMVGAAPQLPVNLTSPAYLAAVERVLSTRPAGELRAFLRWSFLFSLRGELPAPYNAAFGDIAPHLRVKLGNPAGQCRDATIRAMGVEFSRQYATRILGWKARDAAHRIGTEIQASIVKAVAQADWLSPEARQATADKLARTDLKIGFPDLWPETGAYPLNQSTFLANVLAARSYEQRRAWDKARREHKRSEWDMIVSPWVGDGMAAARLVLPNGFPDALSNSLIMTAAFLGAPRFDADAAPELNYATFGAVFAHEFVHVAQTHMFGAEGQEQALWSPADIAASQKQGQCIVDQASAYEALPGLKMNGERQYGENVADTSGLRLAFDALQARLGSERLYRQDASGTSPAQRFFYRFAQNRCAAQTPEYLRHSIEADRHAPPEFRVNAPVSNLPAFGRAFNCKPGARMVRPEEQQCRVW